LLLDELELEDDDEEDDFDEDDDFLSAFAFKMKKTMVRNNNKMERIKETPKRYSMLEESLSCKARNVLNRSRMLWNAPQELETIWLDTNRMPLGEL
jgi:hypothetical protein